MDYKFELIAPSANEHQLEKSWPINLINGSDNIKKALTKDCN